MGADLSKLAHVLKKAKQIQTKVDDQFSMKPNNNVNNGFVESITPQEQINESGLADKRFDEALQVFDIAIAQEPDFAGTYANRGILYDQMGQYQKALEDYERALTMDPELAEGPKWLTRFLRLQPDKPPTIADRAQYLKQQLAKPESERVLRLPGEDEKQRPYKL